MTSSGGARIRFFVKAFQQTFITQRNSRKPEMISINNILKLYSVSSPVLIIWHIFELQYFQTFKKETSFQAPSIEDKCGPLFYMLKTLKQNEH